MKYLYIILLIFPIVGFSQNDSFVTINGTDYTLAEFRELKKDYLNAIKHWDENGISIIHNKKTMKKTDFLYYDNGQLRIEMNYEYGLGNGIERAYYENGQIKEDSFRINGLNDGMHKGYYENGQLSYEGLYKLGTQIGLWKNYYENGQLSFLRQFNNKGELVYEKCWDEKGDEIECK